MAKLTDKEILTYIKDNNLEENLEYGVEKGQDYIAHDLLCSSRKDVYRTYEDARKIFTNAANAAIFILLPKRIQTE